MQLVNPPPSAVLRGGNCQSQMSRGDHGHSLERGEMRDLLITEQLEVSPEPSKTGIVEIRIGEVVETLVPVVQL